MIYSKKQFKFVTLNLQWIQVPGLDTIYHELQEYDFMIFDLNGMI